MPSPSDIHADPDAVNLPDAAAQLPNTAAAAADRMPIQADTVNPPRPTINRSADHHDPADNDADAHDNNSDTTIDAAGHGRFGMRAGDVVESPDAGTGDATDACRPTRTINPAQARSTRPMRWTPRPSRSTRRTCL